MHFTIDTEYLCSVSVYKSGNFYKDKENPTEEDLAEYLKGHGYWATHSTIDHPEFSRLRYLLEEQGYIKIESGWWNGDQVLREFYLNGVKYCVGETFHSACATKTHLIMKNVYNKKDFK